MTYNCTGRLQGGDFHEVKVAPLKLIQADGTPAIYKLIELWYHRLVAIEVSLFHYRRIILIGHVKVYIGIYTAYRTGK